MEPFRFASATIQNLGSETLIYKNSFLHLCRSLVSENCCRNLNQPQEAPLLGIDVEAFRSRNPFDFKRTIDEVDESPTGTPDASSNLTVDFGFYNVSLGDLVWFDDDTPPGANLQGNGQNPHWRWVTGPDHPVHSGTRSTHRAAGGLNQHFFTDVSEPLIIHEGDKLFAWVYLDPENPPEVVQLQFNNGNWNHRARWGANKAHAPNLSGAGNHEAGPLPALGEWVMLEVDAATVGLTPGDRVNGWAFTQFGGSAYYDRAGASTMHPPDDRYKVSRAVWEARAKDDAAVPEAIRTLIAVAPADRTGWPNAAKGCTQNPRIIQHQNITGAQKIRQSAYNMIR